MNSPIASDQTLAEAAAHLAAADPIMARLIQAHGPCTLRPHTDYYAELVDAIISQQLSVKAARTIEQRFCQLFGSDDFPTPKQILARDPEEFRAVGLSRGKALYVHDLARHVDEGTLQFERFPGLSNDEITHELVAVKGIGEWTAQMFLMFCLGRLDVLPVGDLGIRNGIAKLYGSGHVLTPEDIRDIAIKNAWHPYESVASWYIWRSLDNTPALI